MALPPKTASTTATITISQNGPLVMAHSFASVCISNFTGVRSNGAWSDSIGRARTLAVGHPELSRSIGVGAALVAAAGKTSFTRLRAVSALGQKPTPAAADLRRFVP